MKEAEIKETYDDIFEQYKDHPSLMDYIRRGHGYHYDEDEQESDILFVGINPSFSDERDIGNVVYSKAAPHPYFKPFQQIHEELISNYKLNKNLKWTHIDLLAVRETEQKQIDHILKSPAGIAFVYDQLMIAKNRILHIKPKVIVVCNSKAREFMGKNRGFFEGTKEEYGVWMGFHFEFNNQFGTFTIPDIPELAQTHVLFSSMLSGQRALDLGSRERMIWQVARVLGWKG